MNYDQVVNLLTRATVQGLIRWETFGEPKLHINFGSMQAYKVSIDEVDIWLSPTTKFWRGCEGNNQLVVLELHGFAQEGITSISSDPELISGHKLRRKYKLMRLYLAVRREHMRLSDKARFQLEYKRTRRKRTLAYFLPKAWDSNTVANAI